MMDDNRNGHNDDDMPEDDLRPQTENGYQRNSHRSGLKDLLVSEEIGSAWNLGRELLTGSDDPAEYLARTEYTLEEIRRNKRIMATEDYYATGTIDIQRIMWYEDIAKISLDRKGRQEGLAAVTGMVQMFRDRAAGMMDRLGQIVQNNRTPGARDAPSNVK